MICMIILSWCLLISAFIYAPSGFVGIYDVPHFIKTLKYDVRIVMSVPKITAQGKTKKLRAYKVNIFIALHTKFSCTKLTFSISLKSLFSGYSILMEYLFILTD